MKITFPIPLTIIQHSTDAEFRLGKELGRKNSAIEIQKLQSGIFDSLERCTCDDLARLLLTAGIEPASTIRDLTQIAARKSKQDRLSSRVAPIAIEAIHARRDSEKAIQKCKWSEAAASAIRLGRCVGRIEEMVDRFREGQTDWMHYLFLARERWRSDPKKEVKHFDEQCVWAYGSPILRNLKPQTIKNLLTRFRKSPHRRRSLLLATRKVPLGFYDVARGR